MTINPKLLEPTLLWENPNPNAASFDEQTINNIGNIDNYKYLIIEYKYYFATYGNQFMKIRKATGLAFPLINVNLRYEVTSRTFDFPTNTSVHFAKAYMMGVSGAWGNATVSDQGLLVPIAIYGTNIL